MGPRSMAAEAALARAERAARQAVRRADARGEDFQEAEPTGSVHAVRLLRATSQLRAHTGLHDLREAQERHLDSLDRQMREVELTRELVAKALESSEPSLPPGRARRAPRAAGRPARLPSAGGAAPELSAEEQPKRAPARAESTPALPAGTAGTPAGRARGQCRLVELRPAPCPPGAEGQDCPCCLSAMEAGQPVLAFPCAAPHHFHARCLDAGCALPAGGAPAPCAGAGREAAGPTPDRCLRASASARVRDDSFGCGQGGGLELLASPLLRTGRCRPMSFPGPKAAAGRWLRGPQGTTHARGPCETRGQPAPLVSCQDPRRQGRSLPCRVRLCSLARNSRQLSL
ncbi:unnamed protein product [Prorocentrum cordatum]|uniref:RING-type domain-containing protein n=1 Tax=Prorocentrum cordatum TaxID=2364126 RepID=A0ABN9W8F4_9DINO|nr:unnamed protein product [Polarella glacialis]